MLDHLDHVQYMISDRCPFSHSSIENGTRHSVPFNVIWCIKGLLQLLKNLFGLGFLKLSTELIIHWSQHNAPHYRSIIKPLLVSVPNSSVNIWGWLFRYRIHYHIKDSFMLQDNLEWRYQLSKLGPINLSLSNNEQSDKLVDMIWKKNQNLLVYMIY